MNNFNSNLFEPFTSPINNMHNTTDFLFNNDVDNNLHYNYVLNENYKNNNTFNVGFNAGYNSGYNTGHHNGFNIGYNTAYNTGYNSGFLNAMIEFNNNNMFNNNNNTFNTNDTNDTTKKNNFNKNNKNNKNNKDNKNNKNNKRKNKKKNKKYNTNKIEETLNDENKPILIIKKISKNTQTEEGDFNSMFNTLFKTKNNNDYDDNDKKNYYLEDSDDDNDKIVNINEIKCNDEYIDIQKENYSNFNIVPLKNIINKNNIESIDDLITIGEYYQNNFFTGKNDIKDNYNNNNQNESENSKSDNLYNEYEKSIIETIIKNMGIPITPNTKIIINGNDNKKIKSSEKHINEEKNSAEEKDIDEEKDIFELYKIENNYYTINLEKVFKMKSHLIKLKKMVGLTNIKNEIIDLILYYLMNFEKKNNNMLHMTLEGSPGCGKTKLAKIISKLLTAMGILDNDKVVYARRTDMIGQYLGQTAPKTQAMIDSAMGGVLFIDEAYSLGNSKKDIYSKECLDVLNQNLSDNKKKFICIIAGYPDELENYFFSSNPGLTRRFPFRFKINDYSHSELLNIFINKIDKLNWKINKNTDLEGFFEKNIDHFKFFGGDIETFIQDIKYSHSRRVVCTHPSEFKIINNSDIKKAFEKFKNRRNDNNSNNWKNMYV